MARIETVAEVPAPRADARTRILDTAYELFSRVGVRAVGIDRLIAEAGVAKATLYHHFASKQELVLDFLDLREDRWTRKWLATEMERRADEPREQLLAIFDVLDEWFHRAEYEGCAFACTLLEFREADDPIRQAAVRHLGVVREMFTEFLVRAGVTNPEQVACQLQTLALGAIVAASGGDRDAARRLRPLVEHLLDVSSTAA
jgi:AcrR family transcriptional regulator